MRLLLIEDSRRLQNYLGKGLRHEGFAVDIAEDGETGLWQAHSNPYDVIILDLMLPRMSGMDLLRQFRKEGGLSQVLILTAKDTVEDRVHGLNQGADDYLVKPFAFSELLARIKSLTRRKYEVKSPDILEGNLKIQTGTRTVFKQDRALDLQPLEYALLEFLAMRRGTLVTRTEIETHLWDDRVELMSNAVDVAVCRLRRKIDDKCAPSFVHTRRGMGYVFQSPRS
jgi:DNA-binding response OmpR family regulator